MKWLRQVSNWLNLNPRWIWICFVGAIIIALVNFSTDYSYARSYEIEYHVPSHLFAEVTGTLSLLVILPFVLKLFSVYPLKKGNWPVQLIVYLVAMIVMGIAHTSIMTIVRYPMYPILGFGEYDPGDLLYRYAMETAKVSPAFWIFYLGHLLYRRNKEKQREALRLAELQTELTEAKLDSLKGQINPHFLFNALNMISSTMYEDLKKADTMLANLSEFLRYSLAFGDAQEVFIEEEVEVTRKYLAIMNERFSDRLETRLDIEAGLEHERIPLFCLQPLVENAIKFTMDFAVERGQANTSIARDGGFVRIEVADNGPGLGSETNSTKVGLKNLRSRIDALYKGKARLELRNGVDTGTIAVLKIPIRANDEDSDRR